jgi:hypothetical protein
VGDRDRRREEGVALRAPRRDQPASLRGDVARERVASLVERFDAANDCADARIARAALGV